MSEETNTTTQVNEAALDQLFRQARTHSAWLPQPVSADELRAVYELAKMGPTSANCCPARFFFLTTSEAKQRLLPLMAPGNVEKTRTAPVTVIIAWDVAFYDQLKKLFPHADMRAYFANDPKVAEENALRNGSLQVAYFILAARALGLDCGPMTGFDAAKVNAEFFPDGKHKVNVIVNLGHGDAAKLFPRSPRLAFEEACQVL